MYYAYQRARLYNGTLPTPTHDRAVYVTGTDPELKPSKDCQIGSTSQNCLGNVLHGYNKHEILPYLTKIHMWYKKIKKNNKK